MFLFFFRDHEGAEILGLQPYRPPHYDDDDDDDDGNDDNDNNYGDGDENSEGIVIYFNTLYTYWIEIFFLFSSFTILDREVNSSSYKATLFILLYTPRKFIIPFCFL